MTEIALILAKFQQMHTILQFSCVLLSVAINILKVKKLSY